VCGCFVLLLGAAFPRAAIVLLEIFSDYNDRAFDSFWEGLLGFVLLPYTTLAYILMQNWQDPINGFGWFFVILGFFVDLGSYAGSYRKRTVIVEA
jgi:hypothetical protein